VKIFNNGHQNLSPPRIIGHEIGGAVVDVGANVSGWSVGDRAQVIAAVPCGECYECRRGWMAVCQNQTSVGYQYDGSSAPSRNKKALETIASGEVPVKDLITVRLPLERALDTFDIVAKGEAIKVTIEP
jgi:threonine dehydrogenase-like Zn-dependent dehydrogenase